VNLVDKLSVQIEQAIERLALPYDRLRLFRDGLPVCGREAEIVAELAKADSRNHRLLDRSPEKGAMVMGTESSISWSRNMSSSRRILLRGSGGSPGKGTAPERLERFLAQKA